MFFFKYNSDVTDVTTVFLKAQKKEKDRSEDIDHLEDVDGRNILPLFLFKLCTDVN